MPTIMQRRRMGWLALSFHWTMMFFTVGLWTPFFLAARRSRVTLMYVPPGYAGHAAPGGFAPLPYGMPLPAAAPPYAWGPEADPEPEAGPEPAPRYDAPDPYEARGPYGAYSPPYPEPAQDPRYPQDPRDPGR